MLFNRLRDVRKTDLRISSSYEMAEMLGGSATGWTYQKLQRLETGRTRLTDEDAWHIAHKLGIPIWTLFVEPLDALNGLLNVALDDQERKIFLRVMALSAEAREKVWQEIGPGISEQSDIAQPRSYTYKKGARRRAALLPPAPNNLRAIRMERLMTIATLATKMGVSKVTISNWETGKCDLRGRRLSKLSKILGCRPGDLLKDRGLDNWKVFKDPFSKRERDLIDTFRRVSEADRIGIARILDGLLPAAQMRTTI